MSVCLGECPVRVGKRYTSASPFTINTIIITSKLLRLANGHFYVCTPEVSKQQAHQSGNISF